MRFTPIKKEEEEEKKKNEKEKRDISRENCRQE